MALPTRAEFLSNLEAKTCDICYDAMNRPAKTPCDHVYCLECLLARLKQHNTCPTCRRPLFESLTKDEENAIDEDDDMEEDSNAVENDEGPDVPPVGGIGRFHYEMTAVLNEVEAELDATPEPRIATFDASAMAQVVAAFRIDQRLRDAWMDEIKSWDVMYTFVDRDNSHVWTFDHITYDFPSGPDTSDSALGEQRVLVSDRHVTWAKKLSRYLSSIPANELSNRVRVVRVLVSYKTELTERDVVASPRDRASR
ncbi:unnamed protein product [Cercospora beticola]|nr:unnamed protein product [Cercospora beticola]